MVLLRRFCLAILLQLSVMSAAGDVRAVAAASLPDPTPDLPRDLPVFVTPNAMSFASAEVLSRNGLAFAQTDPSDGTTGQQSWWPLLYSALIPGTGELSMGYEKRGVALMALEVIAWTGYFYQQDQGLQSRDDYEAFADANWDTQRWADWHPDIYPTFQGWTPEQVDSLGQTKSGNGDWPGYNPWVSKEEDKQHYYENIGKYDWYISGWADYDPDSQPHDTDLRDQYRDMRAKSNDELDASNQFIYLSVATRVFSLVETSLLIHRARTKPGEDVSLSDNQWLLRSRPRGFTGGEVFVEWRFK